MILFGFVWGEVEGREKGTQKEPVPDLTAYKVGMLSLPPQSGCPSKGLFHHRGGVHENFDLSAPFLDQPTPQPFQPLFDQIMVIPIAGIDRDCPSVLVFKQLERVVLWGIGFGQHHHGFGFRPESRRI